jgi:hypothetical protein
VIRRIAADSAARENYRQSFHYSIPSGLHTGTYSLDAFGPDLVEMNISLGQIPLGARVTQDLRLTRKAS